VDSTFIIKAAALIVTADSKSMTYGGVLPALTASFSGLVNSDTPASVAGLVLSTVAASSHAGSYVITAAGAADSDYRIRSSPGTLTISPASLTIQADSASMTYGGVLGALTGTFSGLVNGDTPASVGGLVLSTVPASSPAGTYLITASGARDADYRI